jgi:ubiquitin C-terminal hydrolase
VVAHIGTGGSYGHYVSYIKINNQWFYFNDDEIIEVDDYML